MAFLHVPVIVGAGQVTRRQVTPVETGSPVELMAQSVRVAAEDAGLTDQALAKADLLVTTSLFSDDGIVNVAGCVADRIGLPDARCRVSGFGGTVPHSMLHHAMEQIAQGRAELAVLTGAEAQHTRQQAVRDKIFFGWGLSSDRDCLPPLFPVGPADGACETEHIHGLSIPAYVYPMFENALRERYGRTIADHANAMADLMHRFSEVAADNPYAWFQAPFSAEEIVTASGDNRYIAFPYTKRMNAMLFVDQAAALIVTSEAHADRMGIDTSKRVYLHGYAEAHDHWHVLEREEYGVSPAIGIVGRSALSQARTTIDKIDFFDLYSCFPVAVQATRDMLGIAQNDPRPLTVTGGLPYFGGPGNNYVMHSMVQMADVLRRHPGKTGLVTGNSFYMTKHSAAVCSTRPPADNSVVAADVHQCQQEVDRGPRNEIDPAPSGRATVETYTVVYDRHNAPAKGIVIGKTEEGKRFAAYTPPDPDLFAAMTAEGFCGVSGRVVSTDKVNTFTPE